MLHQQHIRGNFEARVTLAWRAILKGIETFLN